MSSPNTVPLPIVDPHASQPHGTPRRKRPKKRNKLVIVLVSLIVLALAATGIAFAFLAKTYGEIERVDFHGDSSLPRPAVSTAGATNILLLGSDSRDATDSTIDGADMTGFRSDAIMVAQISPDGNDVTIMSIMRDNWVPIEGYGEAKINAAFAYGGVPLAVNTVENLIGARIDHGAIVDFESFKGLTDALGGVTVNNDIAFQATHDPEYFFDSGDITLSGEEALLFVRERYAFGDGDYQRVRNQQTFIKGLAGTLISRDTLLNPAKLSNTFEALQPFLIVDQDLTLPAVIGLGTKAASLRVDDFNFFTSPTYGTGTSADGQSIILPNYDELAVIQKHFQNGTMHEYEPLPDF